MRPSSKLGVAMAIVVAACAGGGSQESSEGRAREASAGSAASPATLRRTIVFVGTSLTAGMGLDPEQAFPALLAEKIDSAGLPYEVVNAGNSGETSAGALRRIDWILRQPMDVLVLETGANDGLRGVRPDSVRANIQGIIDRVRAAKPETRILLVRMEAPPNFGPRYTADFRRIFPDLARENDIELLPFLLEDVAGKAELNQGDGMHPNADGTRVAAETLWEELEPILKDLAD
jgi:acyl-CoA thioesterase-1